MYYREVMILRQGVEVCVIRKEKGYENRFEIYIFDVGIIEDGTFDCKKDLTLFIFMLKIICCFENRHNIFPHGQSDISKSKD